MARRRRLLPDLRISAPSVVARILVWARDATDFRPSMNGVGGACASRRTLWESSRERWRDGVGCCRTLGFRPPSVVARILARVGDATDFRPSMNGVGGACASRRTVWESSRERWRDGVGCCRTLGFRPPSVVARILMRVCCRGGDATDFRPSMNGAGGACASRRTLWESGRERWRDGVGCCRTLGFRPPSVVACILARAGDATDFRPSINGTGGACPSRRTLWESGRERWRDGAGCYRTQGFRPPRCLQARILVWARDTTDFRPSINGVSRACVSRRTVWESSREPWHDGAGFNRTSGFRPPRSLHAYWCVRDATDFRPSINGGATVPVAAHRLRACRRAMADRRRRVADLRDSVNSHFNLHPLLALTNATLISAH
jgi:hypothetical protein